MADPRFPGGYVDRSPFAPAGTDVARACAADPRVADLPLCAPILARIVPEITGCFQGRMRKGRRSVDPRPFIPLTGYALGAVETSDLDHRLRRGTGGANLCLR